MIPGPKEVTPAWLTEQLVKKGLDCQVNGFTEERIGTGQIGMCIRYQLDAVGEDAPRSLVGKFASPDPLSSSTGVQLLNYLKEVRFYQVLQDKLTINTPRCFFAEINGEGPEFMLLLEDLTPAKQGDQLAGCDAEVATAAIKEVVGLHAPLWKDSSLDDMPFLGNRDQSARGASDLYQKTFEGFADRFGSELSQDQLRILKLFGESHEAFRAGMDDSVFSPIHIDYRLDNLLIDDSSDQLLVTAVDWQSIAIGNPLTDVGYFLGAGLLPEARRECEKEIVEIYHQRLLAAGIKDYSFDQCWKDYRRSSFAGFSVTVVASMLVQQTQRGDQMFLAMASRHSQHAIDLDAEEFLA